MSVLKNDIAAFIDLDNTLYTKFLWQALFTHHRINRFKRLALVRFVVFHFPLWQLVRVGLIPGDLFYRINATNLAWLIGGVQIERAERIWDWIIDYEILPNLRPEMKIVIENHQTQAHRVIMISGSFTPLLNKLTVRLGLECAIATPLVVKDGHYTGKIIPPLNIGQGKVERLLCFLNGRGKEIDLERSYFYTDSFVDVPVLEMFGNPVAVYPDESLVALAAERGWTVIGGDDLA
ncbi:MAG: HAD-IB family hydrolase [Anaerolineales bacterium]|nr:MAG: HAD-IB family hydrolase [Anaerolineales bacterium]